MSQALQKRIQQIGRHIVLLLYIDNNQLGTRSEQRFDEKYREVFQDHMKYVKSKRKEKTRDINLIKFNANKNADILLKLSKSELGDNRSSK